MRFELINSFENAQQCTWKDNSRSQAEKTMFWYQPVYWLLVISNVLATVIPSQRPVGDDYARTIADDHSVPGNGNNRSLVHLEDFRTEKNAESDILWPPALAGAAQTYNDIDLAFYKHFRMSTISLNCGARVDALQLVWRSLWPRRDETGEVKTSWHGGTGGTRVDPVLELFTTGHIYKVVAHTTYHDKNHPARLSYLELHTAEWVMSKGNPTDTNAHLLDIVKCGLPSPYPGNVPLRSAPIFDSTNRAEDQHIFYKKDHAVLNFFGIDGPEVNALGVTWVPLRDY